MGREALFLRQGPQVRGQPFSVSLHHPQSKLHTRFFERGPVDADAGLGLGHARAQPAAGPDWLLQTQAGDRAVAGIGAVRSAAVSTFNDDRGCRIELPARSSQTCQRRIHLGALGLHGGV